MQLSYITVGWMGWYEVFDSNFDIVAGLGLLISINVKIMVTIEMDCCNVCMYLWNCLFYEVRVIVVGAIGCHCL